MSLRVEHVKNIVEEFAPIKLKEEYDNIGLMVGELNSEVTSILIALDCTMDVINEAIDKGCNLIFTHHPLLFKKPSSITCETLLGRKVMKLIKNGISLYSAHTNLDSTEGGLNDSLMKMLNIKNYVTMEQSIGRSSLDNRSGIGRLATFNEPVTLKELCNKVKEILNIPYLRCAGNESMFISKLAVINGSGQDYFKIAKDLGADCIITGDTTYHFVSDYLEEGIAIIDAGHFGTEWEAFKSFGEVVQNKIINMGFSNAVIISETTRDPYKYK